MSINVCPRLFASVKIFVPTTWAAIRVFAPLLQAQLQRGELKMKDNEYENLQPCLFTANLPAGSIAGGRAQHARQKV
eukprot:1141414-Pelagomonas_calceolata.AAC.3